MQPRLEAEANFDALLSQQLQSCNFLVLMFKKAMIEKSSEICPGSVVSLALYVVPQLFG